jgi:hypothetical protein
LLHERWPSQMTAKYSDIFVSNSAENMITSVSPDGVFVKHVYCILN